MANVLGNILDDRETAAIGASTGEEVLAMDQLLAGNAEQRGAEIESQEFIRRAVDAVVYEQWYLEVNEANLRLILDVVETGELKLNEAAAKRVVEIKSILNSGDQGFIDLFIESIQQLRLFDARDKDLSNAPEDFHPITIDIKFRASEADALNRKSIRWRAKENGDESMMAAIDTIKEAYDGTLGYVRRYIIAYEWLPPTIVEAVIEKMHTLLFTMTTYDRVKQRAFDEFSVKLDVRYDIVSTPDGREVRIVTREAEVNGERDDHVNFHLEEISNSLGALNLTTFVPAELNFGELALSDDPDSIIDQLLSPISVDRIRSEMNAQVDRVMSGVGEDQIVVDLEGKAEVIEHLTTAGDLENFVLVVE